MQKKNAIIYGIKTGDVYHYIGKRYDCRNADGNMCKSDVGYQYVNPKIKNVFDNNEVVVEPLVIVPEDLWYDKKLQEVLEKHRDKHPLLNSQWMLEGKRGYWEGKQRDANTIKRLAESKYIKVVEYDEHGGLKKIWNSAKEVAIKVFGDYEVVNGGGKTSLYDKLNANCIKGRLYKNSYWFRYSELIEYFNQVPKKLNIENIRKTEKEKRSQSYRRAYANKTHTSLYTVEKYVDGKLVETYLNTSEAGYKLRLTQHTVQKICRGCMSCADYELKYGEKVLQPIRPVYPKYKIRAVKRKKKI